MGQYLVRRILLMIPTLVLASIFVFMLMRMIPGDPAAMQLGSDVSREIYEELRQQLGLDEPAYLQYFSWVSDLLRLDLGRSLHSREPVTQLLSRAIPVSAQLAVLSLSLSVVVGVTLGTVSAVMQGSPADYVARVIAIFGLSIPSFVLGVLLLLLPALWFGWFPPLGYVPFWEDPRRSLLQFFLPAFTVGYLISGVTARMVRSSMLEVLRQDYIRTARAKGLRDSTVYFRHAFKNASIPVVTIMGAQMGTLLGGALISETIFSLPGVGRLFITSVASRDYPIIQATVLFMIFAVLVVNLVVDMLYAALDPRIRYS